MNLKSFTMAFGKKWRKATKKVLKLGLIAKK